MSRESLLISIVQILFQRQISLQIFAFSFFLGICYQARRPLFVRDVVFFFFFFMGTDHLRRNPVRVSASREGELLLLLLLLVVVVVVLGGGSAQTRLV